MTGAAARSRVVPAVGPWVTTSLLGSLRLARDHALRSIAFPAISTGIYGFPKDQAALIAARTVQRELVAFSAAFDLILFICFDEDSAGIYARAVEAQAG